uniref:Tetratricopeptide repeat domain containing protein n=1 Tax=Babesia bovis TaxID=5865 RepID=S6BPV5_BABBO|nr:tetratricopeptide repeat domain containing protein [Babesia bovis]
MIFPIVTWRRLLRLRNVFQRPIVLKSRVTLPSSLPITNVAIDEYKRGIEWLDKLPSKNKDHNGLKSVLHCNLSACYLGIQEYRNAINSADESIRLDSGNKKALYRRALARFHGGYLDEAKEDCQSMLADDADNSNARMLLAKVNEKLKAARAQQKKACGSLFNKSGGLYTDRDSETQNRKQHNYDEYVRKQQESGGEVLAMADWERLEEEESKKREDERIEKDMSSWCRDVLRENLLMASYKNDPSDGDPSVNVREMLSNINIDDSGSMERLQDLATMVHSSSITVKSVDDMECDAQIALIRGTLRYMFDFSCTLVFTASIDTYVGSESSESNATVYEGALHLVELSSAMEKGKTYSEYMKVVFKDSLKREHKDLMGCMVDKFKVSVCECIDAFYARYQQQ